MATTRHDKVLCRYVPSYDGYQFILIILYILITYFLYVLCLLLS